METMNFRNAGYVVYNIGIAAVGVLMSCILIHYLNEKNSRNRAVKAQSCPAQTGQWAILAVALVLLAVRFILPLGAASV